MYVGKLIKKKKWIIGYALHPDKQWVNKCLDVHG